MLFILSGNWNEGIAAVVERLVSELTGGKSVAWLVSGGSQIPANVEIMNQISEELSLSLTVSLIDERYGPVDHSDSNWAQLMKAGFEGKKAQLKPVIQAGLSFEQNAAYFNELISKVFDSNDIVIGQLGIGPDGHTAGILPHSPACDEAVALATGYEAPPLKRLTTTFPALKKLNAAYVLAFGDNKKAPLSRLKNGSLPLEEQPAQILRAMKETYVYNDQVGEANG